MINPRLTKVFAGRKPSSLAAGLAVVVVSGIAGYAALHSSHAGTLALNKEAETGTVSASGKAAILDMAGASGGKAVKFGASSTVTLVAPSGLVAFTGGNSVALRWDGSAGGNAGVRQYNIFRNGTQIATVTPGVHADFPEKDGNGYTDTTAGAGQTLSYEVQAVSTSGTATAKSAALSVTNSTSAVPNVTVDSSAASDLNAWAQNNVVPLVKNWYPKIAAKLATPGYTPPSTLPIVINDAIPNSVNTFDKGTFNLNATYYRAHPQAFAGLLYGLTYTIVNPAPVNAFAGKYDAGSYSGQDGAPVWLISGIIYWPLNYMVRTSSPTVPDTNATYFPGYDASAPMLDRAQNTYDPNLLHKLTAAIHNGTYTRMTFQTATGKTFDQAWTEFSGRAVGIDGQIKGPGGGAGCLVAYYDSATNYSSYTTTAECHGDFYENWATYTSGNGQSFSVALYERGRCLQTANNGTADGTLVSHEYCNGSAGQQWKTGSNGSLVHVASGKCVQATGGVETPGTKLVLAACNGSTAQKWTMPLPMNAPTGLHAYTGGDSIGINWDVQVSNPSIKQYNVYRDGVKVGTTSQADNISPWRYATQYVDKSISTGRTYSYKVESVDNRGIVSAQSAALSVTVPSNVIPVPTITVDPSIAQYMPGMVDWVNNIGVPIMKAWYPKNAMLYAYPDYTPRNNIALKTMSQADYEAQLPGSAAFARPATGEIYLNPGEFTKPDNAAFDVLVMVHESTHIIQSASNTNARFGWLDEGEADFSTYYVANNNYNYYGYTLPKPDPTKTYFSIDKYETAAYFLNFIAQHYDATWLHRITVAQHNDTSNYNYFQFSDGNNIEQAWGLATGSTTRTGAMKGSASSKCVDDKDGDTHRLAIIRIWPCNGAIAQKWTVHPDPGKATVHFAGFGRCLDVNNGGTANGTPMDLYDCNGTTLTNASYPQQEWTLRSDGSIVSNLGTNKCMAIAGNSSADGSQMVLSDCNGSSSQRWAVPQ